jgi:hypothetical protein
MKEYFIENKKEVSIENLSSPRLLNSQYTTAHKGLVISCHDVFIKYNDGIILVERDNNPMKGELWPIGGRIERGMKTQTSLAIKTIKESNLNLNNIKYLGSARLFMETDPFNHGRGTDTTIFVYFAEGFGNLLLDDFHKNPQIIKPEDYLTIEEELHPYVRDWMDEAMSLVE